jgi:hypothetical protein
MKTRTTAAVSIAAALFVSTTLLGATAAHAQSGAYYVATPVTAPAPTRTTLVTRSTAWRLQGTTLVAAQAPERPQILCRLVADRVGALAGFSVAGKPLDADALARFNAKAGGPVTGAAK